MLSYTYLPTRGEFKVLALPGSGHPARSVTTVADETAAATLAEQLTLTAAVLLNEAPVDPVYAAYLDGLDPADPRDAEELRPPFPDVRGDLAVFGLDHPAAQIAFAHIGVSDDLRDLCRDLPEPVRRAVADEVGLLAATMLTAHDTVGTAPWVMWQLNLAALGDTASAAVSVGAPVDPFRHPDLELDRLWDPFRQVWTASCRRCWCRFALEPVSPAETSRASGPDRVAAEAAGCGTVLAPRFEPAHGCRSEDCVCHDVAPVLPGTSRIAGSLLEAAGAVAQEIWGAFGTDQVAYLATGGVLADEGRLGHPDDPGVCLVVGELDGGWQLAFGPDPDAPGRWLVTQRQLDYDDIVAFGLHLVPVTGELRTRWMPPQVLMEHDPAGWPDTIDLVTAVVGWYHRQVETKAAGP